MKKVLKYVGIFIAIILLIMILAPLLFKKQIVTTVKKEANKQVNAVIDFDNDISLSFFRNFPNASLGIDDLSIVGEDKFEGDTLAYVHKLHVVINLASLFGNTYQIKSVSLEEPFIQLLVDSTGYANWDIAKEDTTAQNETSGSIKIGLQEYHIDDGHIIYADSSIHFLLDAEGLDHTGQGDFTLDVFNLKTKSHVNKLTVAYGGIPYLDEIETDINANIKIDLPNSKYSFSKGDLKLNGLSLGVNGYVALPNEKDVDMNLSFDAEKANFKNFLSLIPAIYQKDFDDLKASGKLAFNGYVKGVYNEKRIPTFGLQMTIDNGMFQYPSVPEPLSDVNLALHVKNEDGVLDHTLINVKKLHFRMGNNPFDAHFKATQIQSNPTIDGAVKGKLDLSEVSKIYPLEKGTKLSGLLNLDVKVNGSLNDIEKKHYEKFQADGHITAQHLVYQSEDLEQDVKVPQGKLNFSPQQVAVKDLKVRIGHSDIAADGAVDNIFGYFFGKDVLRGHFNIQSQLLDLNEIMGADSSELASSKNVDKEETDTAEGVEAVVIPKDIAFDLGVAVGRFVYDNYELTNVKGQVRVANGILTIQNLSTNMLEGSAKLTGAYNTQNPELPKTDIDFKVNSVNIQKTFKTFNTVRALAPVASFVNGSFSGDISMSTQLNDHLYPKLTTLNSIGNITIPDLDIKGFGPLKELANKLGIPKLKDLNINKVFMHFKVDSGYLIVQPFDFKADNIDMNVSGKNGLNKEIDYTIQMNIPREKLGDVDDALTNLIAEANKATKGNIDLGEKLPLRVHLGGTVTHPKVRLDFSQAKDLVKKELKSEAKQQVSQGVNKLLDKLVQSEKDSTATHASDTTGERKKQSQQKKGKDLKKELKKGIKDLFK